MHETPSKKENHNFRILFYYTNCTTSPHWDSDNAWLDTGSQCLDYHSMLWMKWHINITRYLEWWYMYQISNGGLCISWPTSWNKTEPHRNYNISVQQQVWSGSECWQSHSASSTCLVPCNGSVPAGCAHQYVACTLPLHFSPYLPKATTWQH